MLKRSLKYCLLISGFIAFNGHGLESFQFPKHLQNKVIKQVKKIFDLDEFVAHPIIIETATDSEIMWFSDPKERMVGYGVITLSNGCKIGGCMAPGEFDPETEHEQFYFLTLYDSELNIRNVKVLEYTSQYGYEITAKSWLKQFAGKKAGNLRIGVDIDGISGATISVRSIIDNINDQQNFIEHSLNPN